MSCFSGKAVWKIKHVAVAVMSLRGSIHERRGYFSGHFHNFKIDAVKMAELKSVINTENLLFIFGIEYAVFKNFI